LFSVIDNADGSRTKSTVAVDLRKKASDAATRSEAGAALATWKHQHTGPRARRVSAARAAKAYWDGLTPSDRKIEMRRRRKLGMLRRKKRALGQKEDG
jgi:hypothetical protein